MSRRIDADELMFWITSHDHDLKDESNHADRGMFTIEIIRAVEKMLTVDASEVVRHGHWIFNPKDAIEMMFTLPKCSECGAESSDGGNYCPNCGAKMDEVKE